MIYISADDYGLCDASTDHIMQCVDKGALNKVSVFANFSKPDLSDIVKNRDLKLSLHLNLVEGKCLSDARNIDLLADKDGNFKNTFFGLFNLNLFNSKLLENQSYIEIRTQVLYWKSILPDNMPFCIDSHQHVHMIPSVFRALIRVLKDENINPDYLRIPSEPILPYIKTPSLYFTYSAVNLVKQWLLKLLWQINKKHTKNYPVSQSYFFGILFSGKMDEKRVSKILPKYLKMAQKNARDVEVLFHPGYIEKGKNDLKNICFKNFYLSENRKTEFDSVINIFKKEVYSDAVYRAGQSGRENKGKVASDY